MNEMQFEKLKKNIIVVPEADQYEDDFKEPTKFYIINPMGDMLFFKTRSRLKAQQMVDALYGKGFFTIKCVVHAAVR